MKRPNPEELVREHPWTALAVALAAGALLAAATSGSGRDDMRAVAKRRIAESDDFAELRDREPASSGPEPRSPMSRVLDGIGAMVMSRAASLFAGMHDAADAVAPDGVAGESVLADASRDVARNNATTSADEPWPAATGAR